MNYYRSSETLDKVHSDIRGAAFIEANRMVAEGTPVMKLNTGNPATFGFTMPDSVRNALLENADKAVAYCDVKGMPAARNAILKYHLSRGIQGITAEDIYIGNGVSEVAQMAMTAWLNHGDEVLLPQPCYSLWSNLAYITGARPVFYRCDESSNWFPDPEDIKSKITYRTRIIVLINPNNPTGAVYPPELVRQITDIAREYKLIIFSDEIYDRLIYEGNEYLSTATVAPDLPIITFNGLSKSHIICGFRCGWMVLSGPKSFRSAIDGAIQKLAAMRLCGNALTQLVVPAALEDDESTKAMLVPGGRLYEQRKATFDALDQIPGVSYVPNNAAFYLFPKIDTKMYNIKDDKKFQLDVLHGTHVLFVPGSGFDWPEPDHLRLVMLPEPGKLTEALLSIGEFLKTYRQE